MTISNTIIKAVASAKIAMGDLIVPMTLVKRNGTYDTSTGKVVDSETRPTVDVALLAFDFNEIDNTNVRSDDLKGIVFDVEQTIDTEDMLTANGIEYKVMSVKPYLAGINVVVNEVHLRK